MRKKARHESVRKYKDKQTKAPVGPLHSLQKNRNEKTRHVAQSCSQAAGGHLEVTDYFQSSVWSETPVLGRQRVSAGLNGETWSQPSYHPEQKLGNFKPYKNVRG